MKNLLLGLSLYLFCYFSSVEQCLSKDKNLQLSNTVIQMLNEISNHNIYEYKTVGIAGRLSEQYLRFEKLERVATIGELIHISKNHKNAVVRLYAFQALKCKGILIPKDLQEQFSNDKSEIKTLNGCFGNISKINELSKENICNLQKIID